MAPKSSAQSGHLTGEVNHAEGAVKKTIRSLILNRCPLLSPVGGGSMGVELTGKIRLRTKHGAISLRWPLKAMSLNRVPAAVRTDRQRGEERT